MHHDSRGSLSTLFQLYKPNIPSSLGLESCPIYYELKENSHSMYHESRGSLSTFFHLYKPNIPSSFHEGRIATQILDCVQPSPTKPCQDSTSSFPIVPTIGGNKSQVLQNLDICYPRLPLNPSQHVQQPLQGFLGAILPNLSTSPT
jgi:hypothetical protein